MLDDIAQEYNKTIKAMQLPTLLVKTQEELIGNLMETIIEMFNKDLSDKEESEEGEMTRMRYNFELTSHLSIPPHKIETYLSNMGSIGTNLINWLSNQDYIEICMLLSAKIGELLNGIAEILPQHDKNNEGIQDFPPSFLLLLFVCLEESLKSLFNHLWDISKKPIAIKWLKK